MSKLLRFLWTLAFLLPTSLVFAQSGKIAGVITDASTGEPLPGVNVVIEGTTQGAVTNVEGFYSILNVRPGTYAVRASFIGYTPQVKEDVRVNIDLTTELDFQLQEETVGLDEMVVTAERPVVQRDVSASVANINAAEIQNLPVADVEKVIGLQAGFERGLSVRGAGGSQVQFMVDGFSTQGGMDNIPFTGISYTAVDEVQVQTGGFSAEYGNVRSGLINVVTKEGARNRYTADVIVRYSPPSQKYFPNYTADGREVRLPNDDLAYFARPYFDPDVAFEGTTSGAWDQYMQDQYPEFVGWNALAESNAQLGATPQQMQEAFRWYLRKDFEIDIPDYEVDATIGGPVPGISPYLGDLRFLASYRQTQTAFIIPFIRDSFDERTAQGKLTSDLAQGMKLQLQGLWSRQYGINQTETGRQYMFTGDMPYYPWDSDPWDTSFYLSSGIGGNHIFATHWRNPMNVTRFMLGGQFTHTLNPTTFYEVQLQRFYTDYFTFADRERNYDVIHQVGPIELTEEPFGWEWRDAYDVVGTGLRTGGHWFSARDTSSVARWVGKFDLTSQLNRYSTLKTGLEYVVSNYDVNYGEIDDAHPHHTNPKFVWNRSPQQGALYAQNKLEFRGMVANLGLRLDYFHAGGDWYEFDPFSRVFAAQIGRQMMDDPEALNRDDWGLTSTERQFALSPRLGVSFPITENSKLYFNYGHFREMPDPLNIFNIEEINTGAVNFIGNPNLPMEKTVAYELGYEQNIADMFLLRLAGYYRDLSNQGRGVRFESIDREVAYTTILPYNYGDVRGFEVTLSKNRGEWIRGFVNYTYMAWKGGNFGFSNIYENRVTQRQYLLSSTDYYPSTPIPEPYARFNLEFLVPDDFGPDLGGTYLLGDWRINFLGEWRQGTTLTFNGQSLQAGRASTRELQGNVKLRDFYNLDMRFSKNFNTPVGDAQLFIDLTNVLNLRHMYTYGGGRDQELYLRSLHLPAETFEGLPGGKPTNYTLIPGSDRIGDYRKPGVAYQPIEAVGSRPTDAPDPARERAWRWAEETGAYYRWSGSAWEEVPQNEVRQVLDDKAYIDMPNLLYNTFLNPRNVFFGLRISL